MPEKQQHPDAQRSSVPHHQERACAPKPCRTPPSVGPFGHLLCISERLQSARRPHGRRARRRYSGLYGRTSQFHLERPHRDPPLQARAGRCARRAGTGGGACPQLTIVYSGVVNIQLEHAGEVPSPWSSCAVKESALLAAFPIKSSL